MTAQQKLPPLHEKIKGFPKGSGVYLMKDEKGQILYVGKAKNLKTRVRQYFSEQDTRYQIRFLMARVHDIDFIETLSEKEALLLENSLIKKHKPRYNFFLKDDKTYLSLKITAHDYPKLVETRRLKKNDGIYFGPFTNTESLREVKEFIYRHFQLRTCSDRDFEIRTRPCLEYQIKRCSAPCVGYVSKEAYAGQIESVKLFLQGQKKTLQKQIKQSMKETSQKEDFENAARFRDLLQNMEKIFENQNVTRLSFDFSDVLALSRQDQKVGIGVLMVREAELIDSKFFVIADLGEDQEILQNFITQYYSNRAFIPKNIFVPFPFTETETLEEILSERAGFSVTIKPPYRKKEKNLLRLAQKNLLSHFSKDKQKEKTKNTLLKNLQKILHLNKIPSRIEGLDISNISGKQATGSLVTFLEGDPRKDLYKKFKIRNLKTPNDYEMMAEVLKRRFKTNWQKPDLLIIDGGRGQLNTALKVCRELDLPEIDVIAIAKGKGPGARAKGEWAGKKTEEIYIPHRKNPIVLKPNLAELKFLQNIRDESHRVAITYHRYLRDKLLTTSLQKTV